MKNNKRILVIINKFPKILSLITRALREEDIDYILDASNYSKAVSLLDNANPDKLLLNLGLSAEQAIEVIGKDMQDSMHIKQGMITNNPRVYYMSLCSTLSNHYKVNKYINLELIPDAISKQQLN